MLFENFADKMCMEEFYLKAGAGIDIAALYRSLNFMHLSGDLILIEAIIIEFCISIKIHLILIKMMKMHFDPIELYSNRSTGILSF